MAPKIPQINDAFYNCNIYLV